MPTARYDGYLFAKLNAIGSKSEGPIYYLQQWDYTELRVQKKVYAWIVDPALHPLLGKKVTILGTYGAAGIAYEKATELAPERRPEQAKREERLRLTLKPESGRLVIDTTSAPDLYRRFGLTLGVEWPYRSIWKGQCVTSQIYEFCISHKGKELWRWGEDQHFSSVLTAVAVPGGAPVLYSVHWDFLPREVAEPGEYVAEALFLASGQQTEAAFVVEFEERRGGNR